MTRFKKQVQLFKILLGVLVFILSFISFFQSIIGFILMGVAGAMIFPKTSIYIRNKLKLNRILKNIVALILFLIGFFIFADELTKEDQEFKKFLKINDIQICGVCESLGNEQDKISYQKSKNISDVYFEKILAKCEECKKEEKRARIEKEKEVIKLRKEEKRLLKDSLNIYLFHKGISNICHIFKLIEDFHIQAIKQADRQFPEIEIEYDASLTNIERMAKYAKVNKHDEKYAFIDNTTNKLTYEYLKEHKIDKSMFENKIKQFEFICDEEIRYERIREKELQQEKLTEAKENRNKCKEAVYWKIGEVIKENLNNPKSFEFVSCELIDFNKTYLKVRYMYRATNGFGALIRDEVIATANYQSCSDLKIE